MQAPIVDQVARQLEGKIKVAKVDVDAAPKTAKRFGIQAIPTLVVFKTANRKNNSSALPKQTLSSLRSPPSSIQSNRPPISVYQRSQTPLPSRLAAHREVFFARKQGASLDSSDPNA